MINCLFYVRQTDSLFISDGMSLGESIMTYRSRLLLRATNEVILLHPFTIQLQQKLEPLQEPNPGLLSLEQSTMTARLDKVCYHPINNVVN